MNVNLFVDAILIQLIGFVALLFVILSFQKSKRVTLLIFMLFGLLIFVVHYGLLGAWIGALMNLLEAGMVFVAYKKESQPWAKKAFWPYMFIILFSLAGFITSTRAVDFMPVLAQIFGTVAVWQKNPRIIRFIMILPRPLWFFYNMIVGSYAGMAAELFIFLSVVIGIVRFDILGKPIRKK